MHLPMFLSTLTKNTRQTAPSRLGGHQTAGARSCCADTHAAAVGCAKAPRKYVKSWSSWETCQIAQARGSRFIHREDLVYKAASVSDKNLSDDILF